MRSAWPHADRPPDRARSARAGARHGPRRPQRRAGRARCRGVGKTALLEAAAAPGFRVLRAEGVEAESELAFAGLHQLLRPLTPLFERLAGAQRAALEAMFGSAPVSDRFVVAAGALAARGGGRGAARAVRGRRPAVARPAVGRGDRVRGAATGRRADRAAARDARQRRPVPPRSPASRCSRSKASAARTRGRCSSARRASRPPTASGFWTRPRATRWRCSSCRADRGSDGNRRALVRGTPVAALPERDAQGRVAGGGRRRPGGRRPRCARLPRGTGWRSRTSRPPRPPGSCGSRVTGSRSGIRSCARPRMRRAPFAERRRAHARARGRADRARRRGPARLASRDGRRRPRRRGRGGARALGGARPRARRARGGRGGARAGGAAHRGGAAARRGGSLAAAEAARLRGRRRARRRARRERCSGWPRTPTRYGRGRDRDPRRDPRPSRRARRGRARPVRGRAGACADPAAERAPDALLAAETAALAGQHEHAVADARWAASLPVGDADTDRALVAHARAMANLLAGEPAAARARFARRSRTPSGPGTRSC